jgi:hypothetical protein
MFRGDEDEDNEEVIKSPLGQEEGPPAKNSDTSEDTPNGSEKQVVEIDGGETSDDPCGNRAQSKSSPSNRVVVPSVAAPPASWLALLLPPVPATVDSKMCVLDAALGEGGTEADTKGGEGEGEGYEELIEMGVATTDLGEFPAAAACPARVRLLGLSFVVLETNLAEEEEHDPELVVLREDFLFLDDFEGGEAGIEM